MQTTVTYKASGVKLTFVIEHTADMVVLNYTYTAEMNGVDVTAATPDPQIYTADMALKYGQIVSTEFEAVEENKTTQGTTQTAKTVKAQNVQRTEDGIKYEYDNGAVISENRVEFSGCLWAERVVKAIHSQFKIA